MPVKGLIARLARRKGSRLHCERRRNRGSQDYHGRTQVAGERIVVEGASSTSSTSSSARIAALEKQITTKETEAEENKDPVQAATIAAKLAALRAELAKLRAAANESEATEQESSGAASRQAEFDKEVSAEKTKVWV